MTATLIRNVTVPMPTPLRSDTPCASTTQGDAPRLETSSMPSPTPNRHSDRLNTSSGSPCSDQYERAVHGVTGNTRLRGERVGFMRACLCHKKEADSLALRCRMQYAPVWPVEHEATGMGRGTTAKPLPSFRRARWASDFGVF